MWASTIQLLFFFQKSSEAKHFSSDSNDSKMSHFLPKSVRNVKLLQFKWTDLTASIFFPLDCTIQIKLGLHI